MKEEILNHFKKADPILYPHIKKHIDSFERKIDKPEEYFLHLCREIAFQQLTGKAGATIFGRFEKLFKGIITPEKVLSVSVEQMRAVGLSNAKASYIHNIAKSFVDNVKKFHDLPKATDEEIIILLTEIKGVGRWTAEMFMIFALGRDDIFSFGDLGLKKGFMKVYGYKREPKRKTIERITKKWTPYRSYASLTLWSVQDVN